MFLALALLLAPGAAAAQSFPPLSGRVVDAANLLDPAQEAQLSRLSQEIEAASTRQFVVATVPDLQGYEIEEYGYRLGREWKIGQGEANNGVILLVAPNERKVRIEVGYGLEPIMTDALSSVIVNQTILPAFRDGDMGGGIVAGAVQIGEQLRLPLEAAEERARTVVAENADRGDGAGVGIAIFWVIVMLVIFIALFANRAKGKRYRGGRGPVILWGPGFGSGWGGGSSGGSSWGGGGGGGGWGGGGGFSGGGGSFGGGGASGGW
nr:TPM domain-containing protein [Sphingomonas japonica]